MSVEALLVEPATRALLILGVSGTWVDKSVAHALYLYDEASGQLGAPLLRIAAEGDACWKRKSFEPRTRTLLLGCAPARLVALEGTTRASLRASLSREVNVSTTIAGLPLLKGQIAVGGMALWAPPVQ